MNTYEAKQAARKANYETRATQAQRQAATTHYGRFPNRAHPTIPLE